MSTLPTKIMIGVGGLLLLLSLGNIIQAVYLVQAQQKNRLLNSTLLHLETALDEHRKQNQLQIDSLELLIRDQTRQGTLHQKTIDSLQRIRTAINQSSNEKKARILRLHNLDSLRDEVTRHYSH